MSIDDRMVWPSPTRDGISWAKRAGTFYTPQTGDGIVDVHDNDTLELPPPVRKQVRTRRGGSSYYMIYIITVSLSFIIEYWRLTSL